MQALAVMEAAREPWERDDARADTRSGGTETEELEDGTRVSADTSRRLSCDTGLAGVLRGEGGEVLDVGRRRRQRAAVGS